MKIKTSKAALSMITVTALMNYFKKTSKKPPVIDEKGNKILKLSKGYGIVGLIGLIFGTAVMVYGLIDNNPKNIVVQISIFIFFAVLGLLLILAALNYKIIISEKEIIHKSLFGTRKSIKWEDIKGARYNSLTDDLVITDNDTEIRCEPFIIGFPVLVRMLEEKAGITQEQLEIPEGRF